MRIKTKQNCPKNFVIALEIKDREFKGGCVLCLEALSRGYTVYFGQQNQLFLFSRYIPKAVWFLKSIVPGQKFLLEKLRSHQHKIVCLDVEGLMPGNGVYGIVNRMGEESIALTDLILFWGKRHFENVIKVFPSIESKGRVTGSPIADAWLLENKKIKTNNKIRQDKSQVILFVSSFAAANHSAGEGYDYLNLVRNSDQNFEKFKMAQTFRSRKELMEQMLVKYTELLQLIGRELPETKVIVRPHPNENKSYWEKIVEPYQNISIQTGGNISEVMLSVDTFIHFNSTTSVLANFLNKKVLMLSPELPENLTDRINPTSEKLSNVFKSSENLVAYLKSNEIISNARSKEVDQVLDELIFNKRNSEEAMSSKKIMDEVDILVSINRCYYAWYINLYNYIYVLIEFMFRDIKNRLIYMTSILSQFIKLLDKRYGHRKSFYKVAKNKWPGLSKKELLDELTAYNMYFGLDLNKLVVKKLPAGAFELWLEE